MKSKDLGFFTQHLEKIVLALGLAILGVILVLYVIGSPYAVDVKGQRLDATAIEDKIEQAAGELDAQLSSYRGFPEVEVFPWGVDFKSRLDDDPSFVQSLPASVGPLGLGNDVNVKLPDLQPFDLPHPPLPTEVVVSDGFAVFDPMAGVDTIDAQAVNAIYSMIGSPPADQPADFAYVSVSGKFNPDQWQARLEAQTANPVPRSFWRGELVITAVYLQRQELDPATGQWSDPIIVPSLPTQHAYTPDYSRNYSDVEARNYVGFVKQSQEAIARPPFVPLAPHSRQWLPPDRGGNLTPEQHRELERLNKTITRLEKTIAGINQNLAVMQQRAGAAQARGLNRSVGSQNVGGGDDGGVYDERGGRSTAPTRGPVVAADRGQELRDGLMRNQAELMEAKRQLNEMLGVEFDTATATTGTSYIGMTPQQVRDEEAAMMALEQSMYNDDGGIYTDEVYEQPRPAAPPRGGPRRTAPAPVVEAPPVNREVQVWAHDLTAERGKTYRYRLLVSVLNPLFREARVAEAQRADHFNKIALGPSEDELAAAPWTDSVAIPPARDFFIIAGTAAQQFATIEVWRYFDGKPRKSEFTVYPGDPIGGTAEVDGLSIDMAVGSVLIDLVNQANRTGAGNTTRMLYVQPGSDQILHRSLEQDRDNDRRRRLENERQIIETLTGGFASVSAAP